MRPVFADAFSLIALSNPSDQHHTAALEATAALRAALVTTQCVLVEVADALSAPPYRSEVAGFLRSLAADPDTRVIPAEPTLFDRGLDLYARRPDKGWSLTDCLSFVVMGDPGLTEALTGDHHFEQAGFRALMRRP